MSFGLKCSPSSADWSLKVSCWCAQRKKVCSEKPKHIWAKIGQKSMQSLRERANFFTISSDLKFKGGLKFAAEHQCYLAYEFGQFLSWTWKFWSGQKSNFFQNTLVNGSPVRYRKRSVKKSALATFVKALMPSLFRIWEIVWMSMNMLGRGGTES